MTDYEDEILKEISRGSGKRTCIVCKGNGICPFCGGEGLIL
ncbi:MAG: hypothetical protein QXR44_04700 [Thermoproteota archaeon]